MDRLLDAPPAVRKAIFGVLAVALLILGYLATGTGGTTAAPEAEESANPGTVITQGPGTQTAPSEAPAAAPTESAAPALGAPLADDQIAAAAQEAAAFTRLYVSYRYDLDTNAWITDLNRYLADESLVDLTELVPVGPAAEQAAAAKYVTTATAQVTKVEFLSASMVTFAVQVDKSTTTTTGTTPGSVAYEISLTNEDGGWKVVEARLVGDSVDGD